MKIMNKNVTCIKPCYRICPIKLRGGNDRVYVYLLTKNGNMSFISKNSSTQGHAPFIIHVEKGVDRREGVKQGSSFDPSCYHICFATYTVVCKKIAAVHEKAHFWLFLVEISFRFGKALNCR